MIREKPSSRARARDLMWRKALRKRRIDHSVSYWPMYDNLHEYSKNKIHCSCSYCSAKTRNKGHRRWKDGNYDRSINYKMSDLRRQLEMDEDERDFFDFS